MKLEKIETNQNPSTGDKVLSKEDDAISMSEVQKNSVFKQKDDSESSNDLSSDYTYVSVSKVS
jgi:hypothetical protein